MIRSISILCLTSCANIAFAQSDAASTASSAAEQTVVVTGSRGPESLENTLWSTTVITRADIESRQVSSVTDLLQDLAGINIGNNGGLGKLSSVFMRGTNSDHTLLLIDGVRVASATAGTAPFELIPVDQIDRIEIVRGPRSTLYGTDAIGGVIQIFTRREPHADGLSFGASVTGGSHDTQKVTGDLQARSDRAWASAGDEYFDTNGINSCDPRSGVLFVGCFADEPDRDGYRNSAGSLAAGYQFNDDWKAEAHGLLSRGRTEFDGTFSNSTDFSERVLALSVDGALNDAWHTRFTLGRDVDNQEDFAGPLHAGFIDTRRDAASAQIDGTLSPAARLIAGVDYQKDHIESDTDFTQTSRSSKAVFAELHGALDGWSTLAGARYEDNEQFGGRTTGNLGVGHKLGQNYRFTATWGTAFHAPTFNDLYYPLFPGFPPPSNPNLKPEVSRSFELGLDGEQQLGIGAREVPLHWSLHAFQTTIHQLITLDSNFTPVNIDESRIRGAELQADWRNDVWRLGGQYTWLDPINRTEGDLLLPRRAKQNAALETHRLWGSLSLGAAARYQGRRFDDLANTRPLGGYVTMDLIAEQTFGKALALQARVANLFDRDYETAAYYLQDGRNYSVTLRYRFAEK